mmetsp:Transcript_19580/g.53890  ORF Transcript_19580/g.53890 Transcript_19580/m.53890 type:complete len:344 (-) Transcript_19580:114-1145(-)
MADEETNKLKRAAQALEIDLVDIREGDEAEVIGESGLENVVRVRGKLRRLVRSHQHPTFRVSAVVRGALRSQGARGNVYKALQASQGFYSSQEGKKITYQGDDLQVTAYFLEVSKAMDFQNALNQWEIHKELALLDGIELRTPNPERLPEKHDLVRFYLQDYKPEDSESPCHTLNQLASYKLSVPVTEGIEPTDPLAVYQALDVPMGTNKHYKCHLKDKALFKSVQRNQNNMVAASWTLHQMLDGLNNLDGMPVVKLSVTGSSENRMAEKGGRYQVTLQLLFFHEVDALAFQAKAGCSESLNQTTWRTNVFVEDKEAFIECVNWKGNATQTLWDAYRAALASE